MTLLQLEDGRTILIDVRIESAADDPDDDARDVGKEPRRRRKKDAKNKHYVDVFCLTHPDEDYSDGFEKHFSRRIFDVMRPRALSFRSLSAIGGSL